MLFAWLAQAGVGGGSDVLNYTQFGVAGLMGALWWWERKYSRQREDQLTQAHQALMDTREHLRAVLDCLAGNTKVIAEFTAVQTEILHLLHTSPAAGNIPPAVT
ncbi:MAG TPA: hypothetical protein VGN88_09210 [Phycisphaerae bacterium]|jgi:hypothetical protein